MKTVFLQFQLLRAAKFESFVSGLSVLHGRLADLGEFPGVKRLRGMLKG